MYCLKCRRVTEAENITTATSRNGRLMRRGQCITCGKTKTHFVKRRAAGGSFLNTFVNNRPFEMHLPGHDLTGPGTKLYKGVNSDGTPKEWSIPINRVDNAAYHHDLYYSIHDDTKIRNQVCDKTMLDELNGIVNPTLREGIDKSTVVKRINGKANFEFGGPIKGRRKS